jgi:ribosomal subunit interface protein
MMDLVVKGRGVRITDDLRAVAAHKLAKLSRLDPRAERVEIEITAERQSHGAATRVDGSLLIPRKVFRAHAESRDVEEALDLLVERLSRQAREHHNKLRRRVIHGANRLKSARIRAGEAGNSPE